MTPALSALVVSGIWSGPGQAQTNGGSAATAPLPRTIAPSSVYGAGPPTDGLDSHPYREREMRKSPQSASAAGGKTRQQARGAAKTGGSGTTY